MSTLHRALRVLGLITGLGFAAGFGLAACIDFYDRIPCDTEDDCPYGYRCNGICEGPGQNCSTDADCDFYEAVKNHRELLCVRMPWEEKHECRLTCTPGSSSLETSCPPGQDCRSLADGTDTGACF